MRFILMVSSWVLCASGGIASECRAAIGEFLAAVPDVRVTDKNSIGDVQQVVNLPPSSFPRRHPT